MKCSNYEKNIDYCNCSFQCSRKGKCCECIQYHRSLGELPACYFDEKSEKTGNRTIEYFIEQRSKK